MRRLLPAFALLVSAALPATAQVVLDAVQKLDFDSPESWAMKYVAAISTPTGFGVPRPVEPGELHLAIEAGSVPSLSEEERRVGFGGSKVEDLNRTSVFGRPRLLIGLPAGVALDLGYTPPVEIDGVEPELLSIGLGKQLLGGRRWRSGLRIAAQRGTLEGDIVCPAAEASAGPDLVANPFECLEPSRDELTTTSYGIEVSTARRFARSGFEPYVVIGVDRAELEFQIDARWSIFVDRTLQKADGITWHAATGFQYPSSKRSILAVELFYAPLDVVRPPATRSQNDSLLNLRALFRYRLR